MPRGKKKTPEPPPPAKPRPREIPLFVWVAAVALLSGLLFGLSHLIAS